jgi:N4-gp56 family major capsid protein
MAYTPAGNLTSSAGLSHLAAILYRKKALDRLQKKFVFRKACSKDMMTKQNGRTVQFFRYTNFSANTTPTTEGTVGTSLSLTSQIVQATVSQYSAFITVSDLLEATAIDPIVSNAAELLGYQAGLSVDTITRNIIDAESPSTNQALLATYLRVSDLRNSRHSLQANDVQPFEDSEFLAFVHPYASYDLVNDPAAMGLADIFKYNTDVKATPLVKYEDRGLITHVAGCKVEETTNVFQGTSGGNNTYRAYVFGKNGIATVDLEGKGPSDITDPSKQRFKINVINGGASIPDPEGLIGAAVSYNFVTTAVVLDGPPGIGGTYRYRTLDPQSTIA